MTCLRLLKILFMGCLMVVCHNDAMEPNNTDQPLHSVKVVHRRPRKDAVCLHIENKKFYSLKEHEWISAGICVIGNSIFYGALVGFHYYTQGFSS